MAALKEPVKIFIVQALACRDTPQEVADQVLQEFGVKIDRKQCQLYDPTKVAGKNLSKKFVELFACGHIGKTKTKGSLLITIVLLFFGILPGLFYEIWRRSGGKVCSACGSQNVRLYIPKPVIQEVKPVEKVEQPKFNQTKLVSSDGLAYNAGHRTQLDANGIEQINCKYCKELIRFDALKCKHCGSMLDS